MPFTMVNKGKKVGEIQMYGQIGNYKLFEEDTTPTDFKKQLEDLGDIELLNVFINSPGGGIFAGITIADTLKQHKALVRTVGQGIVASIATVVHQAGDERVMIKNGTYYMHNPMGGAWGYAKDLRKFADQLDRIKTPIMESFDRVKVSQERIAELMNEESTLTAKEALALGLVDSIEDRKIKTDIKNNLVTFENVTVDVNIFNKFDLSKLQNYSGTDDVPEPEDTNKDELKAMEQRYFAMLQMQNDIIDKEIQSL